MKPWESKLGKWLLGDVIALDEFGNAVGMDGNPHETISAHCGAQIEVKRECLFCKLVCGGIKYTLGWFLPNLKTHCENAWNAEKQMVKDSDNLMGSK